jgi:large subunit ribosomal protein L25
MMEKLSIEATRRTITGKQVGALRRQGLLPAIMYGHGFEPAPITLNLRDATRVLNALTSSSLVTINLEGKENAALVREKQRDYIHNVFTHVDFQVVSLTEKLRTSVQIELAGVSPAVRDFNGVLVKSVDSLEVECFPQDLPERIVVDVSSLAKIGDAIFVRDIKLSDKVEVLTDLDEVVVNATSVVEEKEEVTVEAAETEPEVIEKGKKEEEVPEE